LRKKDFLLVAATENGLHSVAGVFHCLSKFSLRSLLRSAVKKEPTADEDDGRQGPYEGPR
jgi:hypothetical protein